MVIVIELMLVTLPRAVWRFSQWFPNSPHAIILSVLPDPPQAMSLADHCQLLAVVLSPGWAVDTYDKHVIYRGLAERSAKSR